MAAGIVTRRIQRNYLNGTKPLESAPPENLQQVKAELEELNHRQNVLTGEFKKLEIASGRGRKKSWINRIGHLWRTAIKTRKDK